APAKQQNPHKQKQAGATVEGPVERKDEERNCMYELVKHRLVPDIHHAPSFKSRSQSMRTKRSQCDCQEAKRGCDSKKQNRHVATSGELARSQLLFQSVNANCPFRRVVLI